MTGPMAAAFPFIGTLFSGFFVTDLIVTERVAKAAWASATPFRLGLLFPTPLFVWLLGPIFTVWRVNGLTPVDGDRARD